MKLFDRERTKISQGKVMGGMVGKNDYQEERTLGAVIISTA